MVQEKEALLNSIISTDLNTRRVTEEAVSNSLMDNEAYINIYKLDYYDYWKWVAIDSSIYCIDIILNNNKSQHLYLGFNRKVDSINVVKYYSKVNNKETDFNIYESYFSQIDSILNQYSINNIYVSPDGTYNQLSIPSIYNPILNNFFRRQIRNNDIQFSL